MSRWLTLDTVRAGDGSAKVGHKISMGTRRIFSQGRGHFFLKKKVDYILVVVLKTQVLYVTANAQNTLQQFREASAPPLAPACGRPWT